MDLINNLKNELDAFAVRHSEHKLDETVAHVGGHLLQTALDRRTEYFAHLRVVVAVVAELRQFADVATALAFLVATRLLVNIQRAASAEGNFIFQSSKHGSSKCSVD